ncbi:RNA polymerase sigma factor [Catenovulum sp. 2E275]|uniref:RNA polymerase sigma factor n=1 Tax=Catenovulum sp. 2E275 TaxID=2980497 RepID=UPI0021CF64D1|nr:RNA polymerase sigma factor [Catenovulum sp. 2E275]MCU4675888.1 RNA polymerase sigma factor [Catenovulum sp. 2E275]
MDIEAQLIAKVLVNNDHQAFAHLVHIHQQQVRNYARRLAQQNAALADDIAQETFVTAFNKLHQYQHTGSFAGWLLMICYRHFLAYLKKDKYELSEGEIIIHSKDNIEPQIMLEKALMQVSHDERSALTLHLTFGYTQEEVANIMQLPLGTIKSKINRGKIKLTEYINSTQAINL